MNALPVHEAALMAMAPYKVMVDDNFHYMEGDGSPADGTFATAEDALDACRGVVDESLVWEYRDGATADELYERYIDFGDDPFVVAVGGAPDVKFSAWTYAKQRAAELAAPGQEGLQRRQAVIERKRRRLSAR
jgi:hypothetical protein